MLVAGKTASFQCYSSHFTPPRWLFYSLTPPAAAPCSFDSSTVQSVGVSVCPSVDRTSLSTRYNNQTTLTILATGHNNIHHHLWASFDVFYICVLPLCARACLNCTTVHYSHSNLCIHVSSSRPPNVYCSPPPLSPSSTTSKSVISSRLSNPLSPFLLRLRFGFG